MSYRVNIINETPDDNQTFRVTMTKGNCNPLEGKIPAAVGGRSGMVTLTVDDGGTGTVTFSYGNVEVPLQENMTSQNYTEQTLRVNPKQEGVRDTGDNIKVTRP